MESLACLLLFSISCRFYSQKALKQCLSFQSVPRSLMLPPHSERMSLCRGPRVNTEDGSTWFIKLCGTTDIFITEPWSSEMWSLCVCEVQWCPPCCQGYSSYEPHLVPLASKWNSQVFQRKKWLKRRIWKQMNLSFSSFQFSVIFLKAYQPIRTHEFYNTVAPSTLNIVIETWLNEHRPSNPKPQI